MVAFAKHYDAAGNMIVAPKTGDEDVPIHYVYDAWNRQVGVYADEDGELGALIAEYKYDGANRRVSKTLADDTSSEYFYNQGWQLLEERSLNDEQAVVAVNQYVWSASYIDAPVVRFHDGDADGECDPGTDVDDTIRHYTWDANHNVTTTITVDYTETVTTEHYVYSAYGKATVYDEDWTTNLGDPAEDGPLYCGYWFDLETGNDLARTRFFSIAYATWIIRDPVYSTPNLYAYCGNSPLDATDPKGERILSFNTAATPAQRAALTAADAAVAARIPLIIAENTAYGFPQAFAWSTANVRPGGNGILKNVAFTKYQTDLSTVLAGTQARITAGYHACVTTLSGPYAQAGYVTLWGRGWWRDNNTIYFDSVAYFALPATIAVSAAMGGTGSSQQNILLHELSHFGSYSVRDPNFSWVPLPGLPGNLTNVAYDGNPGRIVPSSAAWDAWFIQTLQHNSVKSMNEAWIVPFMFPK